MWNKIHKHLPHLLSTASAGQAHPAQKLFDLLISQYHAYHSSATPYRGQDLPTEWFPTSSPRRQCPIYSFWPLCQWELPGSAGVNWAIWPQFIYLLFSFDCSFGYMWFSSGICKTLFFPLLFSLSSLQHFCIRHRIISFLLITVSLVLSSVPACHLLIYSKYMLNKWMEEQRNEWTNISVSSDALNIILLASIHFMEFFLFFTFSSQCLVQFLPPHPRTWVHSWLALGN